MAPTPFLGISLKAYFGKEETLEWCRNISSILLAHPAAVAGQVDVAVFPSHPFVHSVSEIFQGQNVSVGAQDVSAHSQGPVTGEVTANQLADLGVGYVEVGHAERRRHFGEDDGVIRSKVAAGLEAGIPPVLCVGESEVGRAGHAASVCIGQIDSAFASAASHPALARAIIAYEPVWAIGEAESASPDHILAVHSLIRQHLDTVLGLPDVRIIYGGSAGPGLFSEIAEGPSGLFLGRFAHNAENFQKVLEEVVEHLPGAPTQTLSA